MRSKIEMRSKFQMRSMPITVAMACIGCDSLQEKINDREATLIEELRLGALAPSTSNSFADDEEAANFGHRLFYETGFSGPLGPLNGTAIPGSVGNPGEVGKIACVDCHDLKAGGADRRSRPAASSLGAAWTGRNTPTVLNAGYSKLWQFWDGRVDSVWSQALVAIEVPATHNGARMQVARVIAERHRDEYERVFGKSLQLPAFLMRETATSTAITGAPGRAAFTMKMFKGQPISDADANAITEVFVNIGKALEAFERKLLCRNSPFDKWLDGNESAMSPAAVRGLKLFVGDASCIECHNGPNFTDERFHNTGTPQIGDRAALDDPGRQRGLMQVKTFEFNRMSKWSDLAEGGHLQSGDPSPEDLGDFKTPSLRCVEQTAPYKHNGVYGTLWDVVDHYRFGGSTGLHAGQRDAAMQPLNLSDEDVTDLVEFMRALTGEPVPEALTKAP